MNELTPEQKEFLRTLFEFGHSLYYKSMSHIPLTMAFKKLEPIRYAECHAALVALNDGIVDPELVGQEHADQINNTLKKIRELLK